MYNKDCVRNLDDSALIGCGKDTQSTCFWTLYIYTHIYTHEGRGMYKVGGHGPQNFEFFYMNNYFNIFKM